MLDWNVCQGSDCSQEKVAWPCPEMPGKVGHMSDVTRRVAVAIIDATRAADEEQLLVATLARADELISQGVTTVEIKSGYGLDRTTELRCLRVARRVAAERRLRVRTTFLGAHAIPRSTRGAPVPTSMRFAFRPSPTRQTQGSSMPSTGRCCVSSRRRTAGTSFRCAA